MSYEISEVWQAGPRVKISEIRGGDRCLDATGRTVRVGHTYKGLCTYGTLIADESGKRVQAVFGEVDVCYAANAEVVAVAG